MKSDCRRASRDDVRGTLSEASLKLHYQALLDSFLAGAAAFVSDYYLATRIDGPRSGLVDELCRAEVWERVAGGYRPSEHEASRFAAVLGQALDVSRSTTGEPQAPTRHLHAVPDP